MTDRTLRHPIRGDKRYPKPASGRASRRATRRPKVRQPRIRPRKNVSVTSLVGSPEEQPSRPFLRLNVIAVVVLLLFGVMVLRLWSLQVINHNHFEAAVNANGIRVVSLPAPRGDVVDRNGTLMVGNTIEQEIVLSRAEAQAHPSVIPSVAALVGQPVKYVLAQLNSNQYSVYQPVPVMFNAPLATVQYVQTHPDEFPGVSVQQVSQRSYPQGGDLAPHVLGYVGDITAAELAAHKDQGYDPRSVIGKTGVEAQYDQYLRGVPGSQALEVDSKGNVVGTLRTTIATPGDTLVLNIDMGLQQTLQNALEAQIALDRKTPDPRSGVLPPALDGAAVALNPQNGQVLALVSSPGFDLSQWVGGISQPDLNAILAIGAENDNAIQGLFTPGSTFKLITATAALQNGIIAPTTEVDDTGSFTIPGCKGGGQCTFHDDEAADAGQVDMPLALTKSDDYYFYNLGYLFGVKDPNPGPQPVQQTAADYGLGTTTGIDLPGESVGRVDSLPVRQKLHAIAPKAFPYDTWYLGDNVEMAFGQGETILTPIEQANAYATFANGGTRYAPQVASAVVTSTGRLVKQFAPVVTGHVNLPPQISQPILQGLQGVIANPAGTAYGDFQGFPLSTFPLAGKTGTASNGVNPKNGQTLEPNSWFVAFGPIPNPQYLVLAVIGQGGYGASAAAPVVRSAFNYIVTNPAGPVKPPTATTPPTPTPPTANPPVGTPPPTTTPPAGAPPAGATTTTTAPG